MPVRTQNIKNFLHGVELGIGMEGRLIECSKDLNEQIDQETHDNHCDRGEINVKGIHKVMQFIHEMRTDAELTRISLDNRVEKAIEEQLARWYKMHYHAWRIHLDKVEKSERKNNKRLRDSEEVVKDLRAKVVKLQQVIVKRDERIEELTAIQKFLVEEDCCCCDKCEADDYEVSVSFEESECVCAGDQSWKSKPRARTLEGPFEKPGTHQWDSFQAEVFNDAMDATCKCAADDTSSTGATAADSDTDTLVGWENDAAVDDEMITETPYGICEATGVKLF